MRGHSTTPEYVPKIIPKTEVALALARAKNIVKRKPLPPASVRRPRVIVKPRYKVHVPARSSLSSKIAALEEPDFADTVEQYRRAPLSILAYLRYLQLTLSKHYNPYATYVPKAAYRKVTPRIVWQTNVLLTLL